MIIWKCAECGQNFEPMPDVWTIALHLRKHKEKKEASAQG
jgi:hypothetical protein